MTADRRTVRFEGHDPARGQDTAGVPWSGRTLTGTGFDTDTGEADPSLVAALTERDDEVSLVAAVADARLLVPVVAVPGEATRVDGLVADAGSDLAAVTLVAPDGVRALPAFSSVAALTSWDPAARPVPVTAQRAALAAAQEGCEVIVLDVGAPAPYVLRASMLCALATARPWLPAHRDPQVRATLDAAVSAEPAVTAYAMAAGPGGGLQVTLTLRPGLDRTALQALLTRIGEQIATDGEVRARIDALSFRLSEQQG